MATLKSLSVLNLLFCGLLVTRSVDAQDSLWSDRVKITVGKDENQFNVGWTDGLCYQPIVGALEGDTLEFAFNGHDLYKMVSREHMKTCNFTDAILLANVGQSPYEYTISQQDFRDGTIFFACGVGAHCSQGQQKLVVEMAEVEPLAGNRGDLPSSKFVIGASVSDCESLHDGTTTFDSIRQNSLRSECGEPVFNETDGRYYVSCLSGPATMTPGGVINNLFMMHYPYPTDRRVVVGQRTWEFVQGDPVELPDGRIGGVTPVPVNQLYVHHLSGRIVLGQGTEGIRRSEPDAPFPESYGALTGDEGDSMIFHIIDLRDVDDWLSCVECRCRGNDGTYLDMTGPDVTGGVNCCANCTATTTPTVDYRMRYNVSYSDIPEDSPITEIMMLTADVSPAAGRNIEFDVPSYQYLPASMQKEGNPYIQRLERTGPFNKIFKHEFFAQNYSGPEEVQIFRCYIHLHIAAIKFSLEDVETGQSICDGKTTYGTDPTQDKGFLIATAVDNYEIPVTIPSDRMIRLVSEYNATELHTGVMGMLFLFVAGEKVSASEAKLTVDICSRPTCEMSLLPRSMMPNSVLSEDLPLVPVVRAGDEGCNDTLAEDPTCKFGGLCDCEELVNAPESTGCGGVYSSAMGDVQIDSVCAKYCGCPLVPPLSSQSNSEGEACSDTLADSPSCTFGGLCDCEVFVNAPESTGCGGVYSSQMGDIPIDSVCAQYCGCPSGSSPLPQPSTSSSNSGGGGEGGGHADAVACVDKLADHPTCRFGRICDCEEFVNSPESTGCGGVYVSEMGDVVINDLCPSYCDACKSPDELREESMMEQLEEELNSRCRMATGDCHQLLSNLYTCGAQEHSVLNTFDPIVHRIVTEHGPRLALKHAQLGDPSLHRIANTDATTELQSIPMCSTDVEQEQKEEEGSMSSGGVGQNPLLQLVIVISLFVACVV